MQGAADADATNLTDAAWAYYMAGERQEAAALVERALSMDETYGNAYHLRGWLLLADGRYVAAADSLQKAFTRTPRTFGQQHQGVVGADMAALYYAGVAFQLNGEWEKGEPLLVNLIDYCREQQMLTVNDGGARGWQIANFRARAEARLGRKSAPTRRASSATTPPTSCRRRACTRSRAASRTRCASWPRGSRSATASCSTSATTRTSSRSAASPSGSG